MRQIFAWFADTEKSIGWIARELTRLGVDKGRKSTKSSWHHQQVRRIPGNTKYIGRWCWGTTKTIRNSDGKIKQVPVPTDQQITCDRPELRLVDRSLWE